MTPQTAADRRAAADGPGRPPTPRAARAGTPRWQPLADVMAEDQLLTSVIELATTLGWLAHHTRPARTADGWRTPLQGHKGFPDLVLVRADAVILAELKSATGRLSPEQERWRALLLDMDQAVAGGHLRYRVWRPAHWYSGEIRDELTGKVAR